MADYRKMYTVLFNAITNALECLEGNDTAGILRILTKAQADTEEIYLETDDE